VGDGSSVILLDQGSRPTLRHPGARGRLAGPRARGDAFAGGITGPTQAEAIRILAEEHGTVAELIARLRPHDFTRPATIGGGDWSAKDLLGHLTSWEEHALVALAAWRRGEPAPIQRALRTPGLNATNAEAVEADRKRSPQEVRTRFDEVHARLVDEIRAMTSAKWEAPPRPRSRRSLGVVLGGIVGSPAGEFAHASAHLPDLRAFVGTVEDRV
jgi:uncharacterized protein (TIGR03083 family)